MELSRKIVLLRKKRGWSQSDLARVARIPQPTICRLETGNIKQPRMATLIRIARGLGISIDYLASDEYDIVRIPPPSLAIKPRNVIVIEE